MEETHRACSAGNPKAGLNTKMFYSGVMALLVVSQHLCVLLASELPILLIWHTANQSLAGRIATKFLIICTITKPL